MISNRYMVGVFGSAVNGDAALTAKARGVGIALARHGCTVVTGACSGLPYQAAHAAAGGGAPVRGFSPMYDLDGQRAFVPNDDLAIYEQLIYIPHAAGLPDDLDVRKKYRNVLSTAACDAGIIISGRWGTLHEFCSLVDYGRVVGVLTGTGEIADELPALYPRIGKSTSAVVLFDDSPERLVARVVEALEKKSAR